MSQDRRRHPRHPLNRIIEVRRPGAPRPAPARVRDVSASGVAFESDAPLRVGDQVRLVLPSDDGAGIVVHVIVRHVRRSARGYLMGAERLLAAALAS